MVPIIELLGIFILILTYVWGLINFEFLIIMTAFVYLVYLFITLVCILIDEILYRSYANYKELLILIGMAIIEPLVYHPLTIYTSLKGYWDFFNQKEQKWGVMVRKGYEQPKQI
jgi:hypothetical protein